MVLEKGCPHAMRGEQRFSDKIMPNDET